MTDELFKILFRGDIAEGFNKDDVRTQLIDLFGLKEQTVDALLAGKTATLKKDLDRDGALKFKQAFEKTGAICYIRPMEESEATSAPQPPSTPVQPSPEAPPLPPQVDRSEPESFTVVDTSQPDEPEEEPEPTFEIPPGPSPGTMQCPKCEFVQPVADFCEACGVVILKYLKRQWEEEQLVKQVEQMQKTDEEEKPAAPETPAPQPAAAQPAPPSPPPATETEKPQPPPAATVAAPTVDRAEPEVFTVVDTSQPDEPEEEPEPTFEIPPGPTPGTMQCPKCEFVQPMADFCEACGVVILKYLKRQWEEEQLVKQVEQMQKAEEESDVQQKATPEAAPPVSPVAKTITSPEPATQTRPAEDDLEGFSIVDTEEPVPQVATPSPAVSPAPEPETIVEIPPGPTPGSMQCPKCEFVQPMADCCEACGIVVLKYLQRQASDREQATSSGNDGDSDKEADLASSTATSSDFMSSVAEPVAVRPLDTHQAPATPPFTRIFKRSLQLLLSNINDLTPIWTGCCVLIVLLSHYYTDIDTLLGAPYSSLLFGGLSLVLTALATNATLFLFADPFLNWRPALGAAIVRLPGFIWLHGWLTFVITGGLLGLIVPGYLFARWFCLASYCFAAEDTRGLSSMLRSRAYCRQREKQISRWLWLNLVLLIVALAGLYFLPGTWKILTILWIPVLLTVPGTLYHDAAATRPTLSYDDTLTQRIQWPIFSFAGLLVFMIAALLVLGPGRIRSGTFMLLARAQLLPVPVSESSSPDESTSPAAVTAFDRGVFEMEISGYEAYVYINGEPVVDFPAGVIGSRKVSSPVSFRAGRNILAIRYTALEGVQQPLMDFRIFRWDIQSLKDEEFGNWSISNRKGLRRFEFNVTRLPPR